MICQFCRQPMSYGPKKKYHKECAPKAFSRRRTEQRNKLRKEKLCKYCQKPLRSVFKKYHAKCAKKKNKEYAEQYRATHKEQFKEYRAYHIDQKWKKMEKELEQKILSRVK